MIASFRTRSMLVVAHLLPTAALVDYSALSGLKQRSLAQHAASYAFCNTALPELFDDDENVGLLDDKARTSTTKLMQEFSGCDARFATFAGGCFWGMELAFQRLPGVLSTAVGYTQGHADFPSYSEVCKETTGHTEAVLLLYDRSIVSYETLSDLFFERVGDPTQLNRVGNDRGEQYRTGMYFHSPAQEAEARTAFAREARGWFGRDVVTEVLPARVFWPAEEVHQRFLEKGNGRSGTPQSAEKGATETIRCYG